MLMSSAKKEIKQDLLLEKFEQLKCFQERLMESCAHQFIIINYQRRTSYSTRQSVEDSKRRG